MAMSHTTDLVTGIDNHQTLMDYSNQARLSVFSLSFSFFLSLSLSLSSVLSFSLSGMHQRHGISGTGTRSTSSHCLIYHPCFQIFHLVPSRLVALVLLTWPMYYSYLLAFNIKMMIDSKRERFVWVIGKVNLEDRQEDRADESADGSWRQIETEDRP